VIRFFAMDFTVPDSVTVSAGFEAIAERFRILFWFGNLS
jgi:hypothetical protein